MSVYSCEYEGEVGLLVKAPSSFGVGGGKCGVGGGKWYKTV
jgi:hypothetical protein